MNTLSMWSGLDKAGFAVFRMLLSVLWQSSILLVGVGLLSFALRRRSARVRHAVWIAALLIIPALPLFTWIAQSIEAPQAEIAVMPAYAAGPERAPEAPSTEIAAPPVRIEGIFDMTQPPAAATVQKPPFSLFDYPWAIGLLAYVVGASALLSFVLLGRLRIAKWLSSGTVVTDKRELDAFRAAARHLGVKRDFLILRSDHVSAPVTIHAFSPAVLLPGGFSEKLSDADLRATAIHEMTHIKRWDPLFLTFVSVVRAIFFFHPLVWLGARQVSTLAEQAADDAVLDATGDALPYAMLLTRLAKRLPRHSFATEVAAGIIFSKSSFLKRVKAILSDLISEIKSASSQNGPLQG